MDSELDPVEGAAEATGIVEASDTGNGTEGVNGAAVPVGRADLSRLVDRKGCEYIDGVWVEKPMSNRSGIVGSNLNGFLCDHVRPRKLGLLLNPDGAYRLFGAQSTRIRKPDLSFVATGRIMPTDDDDGSWPIAPDLAVEVISPNESAEDMETKLDEYLRAGVRLVWVVYVPTRNVWAYRPDGTAKLYRVADTLSGEDVLPGFAVPVADLFEGL